MKVPAFVVLALLAAACGTSDESATCTATSCNGHGLCDDTSGSVVCTCDEDFLGTYCDSCKAAFHVEGDTCRPDRECLENTCNRHGQCSMESGSLACECEVGFQGDFCDGFDHTTVTRVEAVQSASVVGFVLYNANYGDEATIMEDVPVDAVFKIYFDKDISLGSVEAKVHIEENPGEPVPFTTASTLQVVTLTPSRDLETGLNHYLTIDLGIEPVAGNSTPYSYQINFYTAP